jgi:hypothetical protein
MHANDRFSPDPRGPVEGGNGLVEGSHFANVSSQSTIPETLNEISQLCAIWYDDEVDRHAVSGSSIGRAQSVCNLLVERLKLSHC